MKVTIAIPNFNGSNLLKRNIHNVLKSGSDEVIIIDDGSSDGSVNLIKSEFPGVNLLINNKNLGFIPSVNKLVNEASGDVVILLNNDVYVEPDFLEPLGDHFKNPKVFAVNLHEEGEGPSIVFWKDGFYEFKRGEEKMEVQKSAWASGGSAAFRKSIWQELGGFDDLFAPFYWEDTDISYRALRRGYEILWEPDSRVKHEHETTIKRFNRRYVRWVQQRNQLLFIWKNISEQKLLEDHKKFLSKRLISTGLGYWLPYLWAKLKSSQIKKDTSKFIRSDREVINYAG